MAFKIGKGVQQVPFPEVLTGSVLELLVELVELGALVSFSSTRDQGALSVTVTCDGEYDREWFRTEDELVEWLRLAVDVVTDHKSAPSSAKRPRKAS